MPRFPVDAPRRKVIRSFGSLCFAMLRSNEHIQMRRMNPDGSSTPLTLPNHDQIKGSTLRMICTQTGVSRDEFLAAFGNA